MLNEGSVRSLGLARLLISQAGLKRPNAFFVDTPGNRKVIVLGKRHIATRLQTILGGPPCSLDLTVSHV